MTGSWPEAVSPLSPQAQRRYKLLHRIGAGAMGVVYAALDLTTDRTVALKMLRAIEPEELFRLKKEFRSLVEISHANLVQLYELFVEEDSGFFTMELVEGVSVLEHVAAAPQDDLRLRSTFAQLARGLGALHLAGKIHRDVKPSNVLVDRDGRVVVLDFGLVSTLSSERSRHSRTGVLTGTLAYMAPEQAWGGDLTPAADLFSLGVILYQALAGALPFEGPAFESLLQRQSGSPPRPSAVLPVPSDLDDLVAGLLGARPQDRPSLSAILSCLEGPAAHGAASVRTKAPAAKPDEVIKAPAVEPEIEELIGRDTELAELFAALEDSRRRAVVMELAGPPGIGKSRLVEQFLDQTSSRHALCFRTKCHPDEQVPFRAIDGIVDDLARHLAGLAPAGRARILPAEIGALGKIFPVLRRVPEVDEAWKTLPREAEPREIRRRAFAAFRAVLRALGEGRAVVLSIDGAQWGDLDSAELVRELLSEPDVPPILFLYVVRSDDAGGPLVELLRTSEIAIDRRARSIEPLSAEAAARLARKLLESHASTLHPAQLEAMVKESGGSPLLLAELARHLADDPASAGAPFALDLVLSRRIDQLPPVARAMLDTVAAAGRPLEQGVAVRAVEGGAAARQAVSVLTNSRLLKMVRSSGAAALTTYHDRIREAALRRLASGDYERIHRALAAAVSALADPDPRILLQHHVQAGESELAAEHAVEAAERAASALAFHRAVSLYRSAIELGASSLSAPILHERLAQALVDAGRTAEGARAFLVAAELSKDAADLTSIRLRRRAAEYFLRSGLYAEGLEALIDVLQAVGLPYWRSPVRAVAAIVMSRLRVALLRRSRRKGPPRDAQLQQERLEVAWSAGLGLSLFDSIRAFAYQAVHAVIAEQSGDAGHLARALSTEGLLLCWEGGPANERKARRLSADGSRLARDSAEPSIEAYQLVMEAGQAWIDARFRQAVELCDHGEAICRNRCVGAVWELGNFQWLRGNALSSLGDFAELRRRLPSELREASGAGDVYRLLLLSLGRLNLTWLAEDTPDVARRHFDAVAPHGASSPFFVYLGAIAEVQIDLYTGQWQKALERLAAVAGVLRRAQMLRLQRVRVDLEDLRARSALTGANDPSISSTKRRELLAIATRSAAKIESEPAAWAGPIADGLQGGIASANGRTSDAAILFERAALGFDRLEMGLHAAACRLRLSPTGASRDIIIGRGVVSPEKMAALLAPG